MIKTPTVLILGAGASADFGFPCGQRLKDIICDQITRPWALDVLKQGPLSFRTDGIHEFRKRLLRSPYPSVDAFLERNMPFERIGKAAIALMLIPLEIEHTLFDDWISKRQKPNADDNWYQHLLSALIQGVPFNEIGLTELRIITFNYDRSLEHFLFESLKSSFCGKKDDEYIEELNSIRIVHVYGSLGRLPWQTEPKDCTIAPLPYESKANAKPVGLAMQTIKIMAETSHDSPECERARSFLDDAVRIYFLGFGYHEANLRRLKLDSLRSSIKRELRGTVSQRLGSDALKRVRYLHVPGRMMTPHTKRSVYQFLFHDVDLSS